MKNIKLNFSTIFAFGTVGLVIIVVLGSILFPPVDSQEVKQKVQQNLTTEQDPNFGHREFDGGVVEYQNNQINIYMPSVSAEDTEQSLRDLARELNVSYDELLFTANFYPTTELRSRDGQRGSLDFGGNGEDISDLLDN